MSDSRIGLAAIESSTHGNVLWSSLDHGATRVGFSLTPAMIEKYGDRMTEAQVIEEAKAALKPFSLTYKKVDWFTLYK